MICWYTIIAPENTTIRFWIDDFGTERFGYNNFYLRASGAKKYLLRFGVFSDGHDKPFCTKAITMIDNFKNALGDADNR